MGKCDIKTDGYSSAPVRGTSGKKTIFNVFLRIILPALAVLTLLVMLLTYLMIWRWCNDVSRADKARSDCGMLDQIQILQAQDGEDYYEVFQIQDTSEYIAFRVPPEHYGEIAHMEPGSYPVTYWYGSFQIMDLSQVQVLQNIYQAAEKNTELQSRLSQIKVYDFSAYRGHTQSLGRGGGFALLFFWTAELFVAGILMLLDTIIGLVIYVINRDRMKNLQVF